MAESSEPDARRPVVIVDDVHVRYKVFATGKRPTAADRKITPAVRGRKQLREVHALKGVSFTAYENDSIGVIGTNGSGKSTLMRTIAGVTPVSEGEIFAVSRPSLLGVGATLISDLSGAQNVVLGSLALGMTQQQIDESFESTVEFAGLRDFIDLPMRAYSSGMSARLKFALATQQKHEILIIDEALAVGDKSFRQRSEARIREIREAAGTVFLVSHSMKSIADTCNRTIWIEKGVLQMDGPTDDVLAAYEDHQV